MSYDILADTLSPAADPPPGELLLDPQRYPRYEADLPMEFRP